MPETPIVELRGVSAEYGPVRALHNVSITAADGEITAIIGVNGAGKTTTLNVMAGLLPVVGGETRFAGEPYRGARNGVIRPRIGFSPEGRRLFPYMSVEDNLLAGAFARKDRADVAATLARVYELFPRLAQRRRQAAGTMSGGEQQVAAIGRALMADPALLLLDEPTLGLAPKMVRLVADMILRIREEGVSIVLVEQNANVAFDVSHHAYVLDGGRVVLEGPVDRLRDDPMVRSTYLAQ